MKAAVTILLEAVDPLMGCLSRDAEAFCQFGNGVVFQLIVFEESLSLFAHGNTFPVPTSSQRKCYLCLDNMCYLCCENFLLPMSRFGSTLLI
jgi:hypothetical protein